MIILVYILDILIFDKIHKKSEVLPNITIVLQNINNL